MDGFGPLNIIPDFHYRHRGIASRISLRASREQEQQQSEQRRGIDPKHDPFSGSGRAIIENAIYANNPRIRSNPILFGKLAGYLQQTIRDAALRITSTGSPEEGQRAVAALMDSMANAPTQAFTAEIVRDAEQAVNQGSTGPVSDQEAKRRRDEQEQLVAALADKTRNNARPPLNYHSADAVNWLRAKGIDFSDIARWMRMKALRGSRAEMIAAGISAAIFSGDGDHSERSSSSAASVERAPVVRLSFRDPSIVAFERAWRQEERQRQVAQETAERWNGTVAPNSTIVTKPNGERIDIGNNMSRPLGLPGDTRTPAQRALDDLNGIQVQPGTRVGTDPKSGGRMSLAPTPPPDGRTPAARERAAEIENRTGVRQEEGNVTDIDKRSGAPFSRRADAVPPQAPSILPGLTPRLNTPPLSSPRLSTPNLSTPLTPPATEPESPGLLERGRTALGNLGSTLSGWGSSAMDYLRSKMPETPPAVPPAIPPVAAEKPPTPPPAVDKPVTPPIPPVAERREEAPMSRAPNAIVPPTPLQRFSELRRPTTPPNSSPIQSRPVLPPAEPPVEEKRVEPPREERREEPRVEKREPTPPPVVAAAPPARPVIDNTQMPRIANDTRLGGFDDPTEGGNQANRAGHIWAPLKRPDGTWTAQIMAGSTLYVRNDQGQYVAQNDPNKFYPGTEKPLEAPVVPPVAADQTRQPTPPPVTPPIASPTRVVEEKAGGPLVTETLPNGARRTTFTSKEDGGQVVRTEYPDGRKEHASVSPTGVASIVTTNADGTRSTREVPNYKPEDMAALAALPSATPVVAPPVADKQVTPPPAVAATLTDEQRKAEEARKAATAEQERVAAARARGEPVTPPATPAVIPRVGGSASAPISLPPIEVSPDDKGDSPQASLIPRTNMSRGLTALPTRNASLIESQSRRSASALPERAGSTAGTVLGAINEAAPAVREGQKPAANDGATTPVVANNDAAKPKVEPKTEPAVVAAAPPATPAPTEKKEEKKEVVAAATPPKPAAPKMSA